MSTPATPSSTSEPAKESSNPTAAQPESTSEQATPASSVPKTPVSLLQELYIRNGITPKYDLVQIEGAVHEPTFKYRVSVGEFVATGSGQSKKKAKHSAAKAVLERIRHAQKTGKVSSIMTTLPMIDSSTESPSSATAVAIRGKVELPDLNSADILSPYDDGIDGNPVGELQELCMNRRMQPPVYEVSLEEGQPHERKFVIVCSVGKNQEEAGCGKSKKLAKRQAAHKMLKRLKLQPVEAEEGSFQIIDEDDLAQGIAQRSKEMKGKNGHYLTKFHRNLVPKEGSKLKLIHDLEVDELQDKSVELLDDVGKEQSFAVTFVELEEKSKKDDFMCLVQLSTAPVAVCFGTAKTKEDAKAASAFDALEYLRLMTKENLLENVK